MRADIGDGTPRSNDYATDLAGRILANDTSNYGGADNITGPHSRYYWFDGVQVGDVSNNGTSDVDYVVSITDNTAKPVGTGFFTNGATHGTAYADFDAAYDPVNGLSTQLTAQRYTVQTGDTLESIAQQVWGDANFWYLIADANGIASDDQLIAGQDIVIPDKVANNQNNANTFRVYDPNLAMGNTSPTHPPKPQSNQGCGVVGQIIETVVSVAVSYMFGPIAGDVAEQLTAMALGDQKNFNWKALGVETATDLLIGVGGSGNPLVDSAYAVAHDVVSQGLNLLVGEQKKFDWFRVADDTLGLVPGAAIRTLAGHGTFGDNILHQLPGVIGATIGNEIAYDISGAYAQAQGGPTDASNQTSQTLDQQFGFVSAPPMSGYQIADAGMTGSDIQSGDTYTGTDGGQYTDIGAFDAPGLHPIGGYSSVPGFAVEGATSVVVFTDDAGDVAYEPVGDSGPLSGPLQLVAPTAADSVAVEGPAAAPPPSSYSYGETDLINADPYIPFATEYNQRMFDASESGVEAREDFGQISTNNSFLHNVGLALGGAYHAVSSAVERVGTDFGILPLMDATVGRLAENSYHSRYDYTNALAQAGATILGGIGGAAETAAPNVEALFQQNSLRLVNQAHDLFTTGISNGQIVLKSNLSVAIQRGNFVDAAVRRGNLALRDELGLDSNSVRINQRLYAPNGSYTVPDIYFPQSGNIIDYSYRLKTINTPQIRGFLAASPTGTITIIPPAALRPVYIIGP